MHEPRPFSTSLEDGRVMPNWPMDRIWPRVSRYWGTGGQVREVRRLSFSAAGCVGLVLGD
jgi:hypothetical protein